MLRFQDRPSRPPATSHPRFSHWRILGLYSPSRRSVVVTRAETSHGPTLGTVVRWASAMGVVRSPRSHSAIAVQWTLLTLTLAAACSPADAVAPLASTSSTPHAASARSDFRTALVSALANQPDHRAVMSLAPPPARATWQPLQPSYRQTTEQHDPYLGAPLAAPETALSTLHHPDTSRQRGRTDHTAGSCGWHTLLQAAFPFARQRLGGSSRGTRSVSTPRYPSHQRSGAQFAADYSLTSRRVWRFDYAVSSCRVISAVDSL